MTLVTRADQERVALLTLNRPERRNALSNPLMEALVTRLREVEADPAIGAVVLTGAGSVFCAGGDLAGGMAGGDGVLASHRSRGRFAEMLKCLNEVEKPIIASLNGDAMGGGLGLALGCDLVVAHAEARLGTPEIKVGLFPHVILAVLQRNIPRKVLMEMVLTGGRLSAEEARSLGIINRVSETPLETARALAEKIAAKSPAIVGLGKSGFYRCAELGFDEGLSYMNSQLTLNLLTEDAMEGVSAFLTKRTPEWKGR